MTDKTIERISNLSDADKEAIIKAAMEVCRWIGWIRAGTAFGGLCAVEKLKEEIEKRMGVEIEEYC